MLLLNQDCRYAETRTESYEAWILQDHFNGDNCDVPCALANKRVPPTTANGRTKLDKNGIANRNVSIAPKPIHA